jgi:hypothetical protein
MLLRVRASGSNPSAGLQAAIDSFSARWGTLLEVGVRVRRPGQACGDRPVDTPELPIGQAALETGLCQVTVASADFRLDEIGQLEGRLVAELTDPSRKCLLGTPGNGGRGCR